MDHTIIQNKCEMLYLCAVLDVCMYKVCGVGCVCISCAVFSVCVFSCAVFSVCVCVLPVRCWVSVRIIVRGVYSPDRRKVDLWPCGDLLEQ